MDKHSEMFAVMDSLADCGNPHLAKPIIQGYYKLSDDEMTAVHNAWIGKRWQDWKIKYQQFLPDDIVLEFFKGGDSIV